MLYSPYVGGILLFTSSIYLLRRFVFTKSCRCTGRLDGRTIILTGPTSGIGLALSRRLAALGANLILAARDLPRAHELRESLICESGNNSIEVEQLDLQSLVSVEAFADRINHERRAVYALVNNAAIFYAPPHATGDNLDGTFQTNFVAPFLLTRLLLPALRLNRDQGGRVVCLLSAAQQRIVHAPSIFDYIRAEEIADSAADRFNSYATSKFCLLAFAKLLVSKVGLSRVTVHCVDPGDCETNIYRLFPQLGNCWLWALQAPIRFFTVQTAEEGAQGVLHALRAARPPFYAQGLKGTEDYNRLADDREVQQVVWQVGRKCCERFALGNW